MAEGGIGRVYDRNRSMGRQARGRPRLPDSRSDRESDAPAIVRDRTPAGGALESPTIPMDPIDGLTRHQTSRRTRGRRSRRTVSGKCGSAARVSTERAGRAHRSGPETAGLGWLRIDGGGRRTANGGVGAGPPAREPARVGVDRARRHARRPRPECPYAKKLVPRRKRTRNDRVENASGREGLSARGRAAPASPGPARNAERA